MSIFSLTLVALGAVWGSDPSFVHPAGVADPRGVWALEANPAGLARQQGLQSALQWEGIHQADANALLVGRDHVAFSWQRGPAWAQSGREHLVTLGMGYEAFTRAAWGAQTVYRQGNGSSQWSVDLGALWQWNARLSTGLVWRDVGTLDTLRFGGWGYGASLRPFASPRLQVGWQGWSSQDPWHKSSWRKNLAAQEVSLAVRPLAWLELQGRYAPLAETFGVGLTAQTSPLWAWSVASAPQSPRRVQSGSLWYTERPRAAALPVAVDVVRYQVRGLDKEGSTANWFASRAGFWKTRQDLLQLGADPQVATVILDLGNQRVAPAMAGILARQVTDLRQKGKRVLAWAQDLDMGTLQVLAAANKAAISPLGMVRSRGYSVQSLYFGQTLQKWGVNVQVVRTGPWKSAMEPFMQGHMSASARENLTRFLTDLDSNWLTSVSQGRKLPRSLLQSFVDSGSSLPREAVRLGIVDTLLEPAELNKWGGLRAKSANLLGLESQAWAGGKRVAVLVLEGQIVDGESNGLIPTQSNLSAPRVVAAIEKLQADPLVKAVVLRVQSPGGSVVGSERIRLALKKLAARKPVVASFGSLAASGAYLFSLPSERIWAEPEGVVGSIGVFAAKVTFQKLLDTLGVHVETVSTHKHAGDNSPYIAWDSVQSGRMQELVGDAWKQFAGLVREARDLDSAQLARVDGGRVFSGARAQSLGLVDTLGGLEQAVAWTAQRVGLDPRAQPLLVDPQANVWDDQVGRWAMAQASPKEMQDIFRIWQHAVAQSQTVLWAQSMEWIWP